MPTFNEDDNKPSLQDWKDDPKLAAEKAKTGSFSFVRRHIDKEKKDPQQER